MECRESNARNIVMVKKEEVVVIFWFARKVQKEEGEFILCRIFLGG